MNVISPGLAEKLAAQWDKGPQVFRNALSAPVFTEREFMAGVLGTATAYMAHPTATPAGRVFVAGEFVKPEMLGPFLPTGDSETFPQYIQQIRRAHPTDEIGMILDRCERHMPVVRDRLTPLLHGLFSRVGYPARQNHSCIYAGTYKTTPFGIHRDDCHALMFCGIGKKTMAFWPRPYFEEKKELFVAGKLRAPVEEHLEQASILEIGPLDVLYWPAAHWHVGLSEGDDFHAALSMGIYHQGSTTERLMALDFLAVLTRVQALDIPSLPVAHDGKISGKDLRAQLSAFFGQWDRLRGILNRPEEAEFRALEIVLRSLSSAGYGKLRGRSPRTPGTLDRHRLQCWIPEALVVAPVRNGLMVGANGSVFFYENEIAAIEEIIHRLRLGTLVGFDEVVGPATASGRAVVMSVLEDLVNAGAVSVVEIA